MRRTQRCNWPGIKLRGDETFFVDLRDSLIPVIGGGLSVIRNDTVSHCFDYQGNLVNVAANEPRIDGARHLSPGWSRRHVNNASINPDTCRGSIVEQASQNEILYFDDIDNGTAAYWSRNNLNATSGVGTNIAGRAAKGMIGNASNNLHSIAKGISILAGETYNMSCLLAAGDQDWSYFRALELSGFTTSTVWFDLSTGTIGAETDSGASLTILDSTIKKVSGGYWCTMTFTTAINVSCSFVFGSAAADSGINFLGDNSAVNTWISAIQVEAGVTDTLYPTMPMLGVEGVLSVRPDELIEYIPVYTETGAVAGEFYMVNDPALSADPVSIFTFQEFGVDTENSLRVHLSKDGTLQFVIWPDTGPASGLIIESGVLTKGSIVRFAATWENNNVNFFVNGVESVLTGLGTKDSIDVPLLAHVDKFYLGSRNSTDYPAGSVANHQDQFFHVPIAYLKVYDKLLTDTELKELSL